VKIQCLYYALDKWNETGGYIVFRKSTHWCMPHVLHLNDKTNRLTHYVPPEDLKYQLHATTLCGRCIESANRLLGLPA